MMAAKRQCPAYEEDLTALHQAELTPDRQAEVEHHVRSCAGCAAFLAEVGSVFRLTATIEDIAPSMRFRRNLEEILRNAEQRVPDYTESGILWRARTALAFLVHRLRTSSRFRLATVSVGAHVVLLLVLSLLVVPGMVEKGHLTVIIDDSEDVGMVRPDQTDGPNSVVQEIVVPRPLSPREGPVFPEDRETYVDLGDVRPMLPPAGKIVYAEMRGIFANAIGPDTKRARLAALLSDPDAVLDAVDSGLRWLANAQMEDGSWASSPRDPGAYRTGVTAAALLAFLSDGAGQVRGPEIYRPAVIRGIDFLLDRQIEDGRLRGLIGPAEGNYAYNHALATLALVEAYALDFRGLPDARADRIRAAISGAVRYIGRAQTTDGGWRYRMPVPGESHNDTSVSVFNVTALAAARSAGFPVPPSAFSGFSRWLRGVTGDDGLVGYQRKGDRDDSPRTLTAAALFLEESLALAAPLRDRQAALVRRELEDADGSTATNGLLRFFSAMAFRLRGERVMDLFVPSMIRDQVEDGSWPARSDLHAVHGGDAFATALNVLTLTSAYRWAGA